ncbi:TPA: class II aldolase/adducin family protein [Candidatus Bathyarchaeota archaeon]|nr:class II aldolase/adducin family protein [Candidatus Bathyarchaeota archaeon]
MMKDAPFTEDELKEGICEVMRRLFGRGLISALGGNVSARLPGAREFWVTPSRVFKAGLRPEDLVRLDLDGNVIRGTMRPSVESPLHAAIYRRRSDVSAVVHAHNPVATGLALAGIRIRPFTIEAAAIALKEVPIVPFRFPGTSSLAEAVAERISDANALVLQNHGVIGVGPSLLEAEAIVEVLEEVAIAQFVALAFTREPHLIPEEDIELARRPYGR